jgi:hypothetical protein
MMRIRDLQKQAYMGSQEFDWAEVRAAFRDPKLYLRSVELKLPHREHWNSN